MFLFAAGASRTFASCRKTNPVIVSLVLSWTSLACGRNGRGASPYAGLSRGRAASGTPSFGAAFYASVAGASRKAITAAAVTGDVQML